MKQYSISSYFSPEIILFINAQVGLFISALLDNSRGLIIPELIREIKLDYFDAGLFLTISNIFAAIMSFMLTHILKKVGEKNTLLLALSTSVLICLSSFVVVNKLAFVAFGIFLGMMFGTIQSISSILTIRASEGSKNNKLMTVNTILYGFFCLLCPILFGLVTSFGLRWNMFYLFLGVVILIIAILFKIFLEEDSEISKIEKKENQENKKNLFLHLEIKAVFFICMLGFYSAGDVLASVWIPSLIKSIQNKTNFPLYVYSSGFFLVLSLSRLLWLIFGKKQYETIVMYGSLLLSVLFSIMGLNWDPILIIFMGLKGPFFPIIFGRITSYFPDTWKDVTVYWWSYFQLSLCFLHYILGYVASSIGVVKMFYISPLMILISLVLLFIFKFKFERNYV